jgi:anthranilate synthase/aminodeoxychorismate synthase-like glutamine amidotransferase
MLAMIDNYDSFTYNLVQYMEGIGAPIKVFRNNEATVQHLERLAPTGIVISPGPGRPESAGISIQAILHFAGKIPILGVCLGHQAIAKAFGGNIIHAQRLMHGKTSAVSNDGKTIYAGMPTPFKAMRYHSLAVCRESLPDELEISAESEDGEIMGLRHKTYAVEGVQFHPESIMTAVGKRLLRNFIAQTEENTAGGNTDV